MQETRCVHGVLCVVSCAWRLKPCGYTVRSVGLQKNWGIGGMRRARRSRLACRCSHGARRARLCSAANPDDLAARLLGEARQAEQRVFHGVGVGAEQRLVPPHKAVDGHFALAAQAGRGERGAASLHGHTQQTRSVASRHSSAPLSVAAAALSRWRMLGLTLQTRSSPCRSHCQ